MGLWEKTYIVLSERQRRYLAIICFVIVIVESIIHVMYIAFGAYLREHLRQFDNLISGRYGKTPYIIFITVGAVGLAIHALGMKICLAITDWRVLYRRQTAYQFLAILYTVLLFLYILVLIFAVIYTRREQDSVKTAFGDSFEDAMKFYRTNTDKKEAVDRAQFKYKCCGNADWSDWEKVGWISLEYVNAKDNAVHQQLESGLFKTDSVPYSCCNPRAYRPCIHKNVKEDKLHYHYNHETDMTIFLRGCAEGMTEHIRTRIFQILIYTFAGELVIQLALLVMFRYLQSSMDLAMNWGDPTQSAQGYLFIVGKGPLPPGASSDPEVLKERQEQLAKIADTKNAGQADVTLDKLNEYYINLSGNAGDQTDPRSEANSRVLHSNMASFLDPLYPSGVGFAPQSSAEIISATSAVLKRGARSSSGKRNKLPLPATTGLNVFSQNKIFFPQVEHAGLKRPMPIYLFHSVPAVPGSYATSPSRSLAMPSPSSGRLNAHEVALSTANLVNTNPTEPPSINTAHGIEQTISNSAALQPNASLVVVYPKLPPPPSSRILPSKIRHRQNKRSQPTESALGRPSHIGTSSAHNGQAALPVLSFEGDDHRYTAFKTKSLHTSASEPSKTVTDSLPVARRHPVLSKARSHSVVTPPLLPPPPPPPSSQPINALHPRQKHSRNAVNHSGNSAPLSKLNSQNMSYSNATHAANASYYSPNQNPVATFLVPNRNAFAHLTEHTEELIPPSQTKIRSFVSIQTVQVMSNSHCQNADAFRATVNENQTATHRNHSSSGVSEEPEIIFSSRQRQNKDVLPHTFLTQAGNSSSSNNDYQREKVMPGMKIDIPVNRNLVPVLKLSTPLSVPSSPWPFVLPPPPPSPVSRQPAPPPPTSVPPPVPPPHAPLPVPLHPAPPSSTSEDHHQSRHLSDHTNSRTLHSIPLQYAGPLAWAVNQSVPLKPPCQNLFKNGGASIPAEHHIQNERSLSQPSEGNHTPLSSEKLRPICTQPNNTPQLPFHLSTAHKSLPQRSARINANICNSVLSSSKDAAHQTRLPFPTICPANYFYFGETVPRPFFFPIYNPPFWYYAANLNRSANPLYQNRNVNNIDDEGGEDGEDDEGGTIGQQQSVNNIDDEGGEDGEDDEGGTIGQQQSAPSLLTPKMAARPLKYATPGIFDSILPKMSNAGPPRRQRRRRNLATGGGRGLLDAVNDEDDDKGGGGGGDDDDDDGGGGDDDGGGDAGDKKKKKRRKRKNVKGKKGKKQRRKRKKEKRNKRKRKRKRKKKKGGKGRKKKKGKKRRKRKRKRKARKRRKRRKGRKGRKERKGSNGRTREKRRTGRKKSRSEKRGKSGRNRRGRREKGRGKRGGKRGRGARKGGKRRGGKGRKGKRGGKGKRGRRGKKGRRRGKGRRGGRGEKGRRGGRGGKGGSGGKRGRGGGKRRGKSRGRKRGGRRR